MCCSTSSVASAPPPAAEKPSANAPAFLQTANDDRHARGRSRSRHIHRRRPPPPMVEDEAVSLARESDSASSVTSDDPPLRGVLEQYPIILEADITEAEAAIIHAAGGHKDDDNAERRFVLMPKSDTYSPNRKDEAPPTSWSHLATPGPHKESIPRRRSRQDLPALQTKVPPEAPAQLRRTTSASVAGDPDATPRRPRHPRTQSDLLSPVFPKHPAALSPRHHSESLGSRGPSPGGSRLSDRPPSRPGTPLNKRHSASFDGGRARHDSSERLARPTQLVDEEAQRRGRHSSPHSSKNNLSVDLGHKRSGRSVSRSGRRHYSSDSEDGESDSSRHGKHRHHHHHHHHRGRDLQAEEDSRHRKYSSPQPSPKGPSYLGRADRERAETFPPRSGSRSPIDRAVSPFSPALDTPRTSSDRLNPTTPRSSADRLNPTDSPIARPRSRQSNPIPVPVSKHHPPPPEPSPSNSSSRNEHKPSVSRHSLPPPPPLPQPQHWQPPPLAPPTDQSVGSYRRYSEDADSGAVAPLPTCPRTVYTRGYNDWYTLPNCPSFDICPSCFESAIGNTELRRYFVRSPPRPHDTEVLCDFGCSPWYRIAWLIIRKERLHDMKIFYGLANIAATTQPCSGKHEAVRQWYYLIDPKTRGPVHNFHVCASCVKSVETILPAIRGMFMRDPNRPMGSSHMCDFRFDSKRFIKYFDILETTADRAIENDAPPDPRLLISIAKRMAKLPECQRDKELVDRSWNVITQLPEFTVCEECFDEIVWPELEDEKAIPMMFNKALQRLPRASCQLYSPKMRGIFRTAVDVDDYKLLASKARERKAVEAAYKSNLEGLKRQASQGKVNPKFVAMESRRVEEEWSKWA